MANALRIGIIGCDTSHVTAFTKLLHDESDPHHVSGARVVSAYPSFSEDVPSSKDRVGGFTDELKAKWGVTICDSIEQVVADADAVLLESVDGRRHLAELQPVVEARKPVFVDKPFATTLADARQMVRMLNEADLPCFSSSSLRFDLNLQAVLDDPARGEILGCDAFGPAPLDPSSPGLFWYGIHAVEMLYALMGAGCTSVQCTSSDSYDLVVGRWGERIGTVRGIRTGKSTYGATVFCADVVKQFTHSTEVPFYALLLRQVLALFRTGKPPVSLSETLEMVAFMEAALESSQDGGRPTAIDVGL